MIIEEAMRRHLLANAAVAAIVVDRVYPKRLPQKPSYPAIVYHRVGTARPMHMGGVDGYAEARFQLDAMARSFAEARELGEAIRLALAGYRGAMGAAGAEPGVQVYGVFTEGELDDYDDEFEVYTSIQDFTFQHQEARPPA